MLDANAEDLKKVKGIGDHAALFLSMLPQVMRRYEISRTSMETVVTSTADAGKYLLPYFFGTRNETLYLLCLDAKGRVLSCSFMAEGSLDRVALDSRAIVETALEHRATSVILAHNHISGLATPSHADVELTLALRPLLKSLNIRLLDHLVVADGDFVSMVESGLIPPLD